MLVCSIFSIVMNSVGGNQSMQTALVPVEEMEDICSVHGFFMEKKFTLKEIRHCPLL